MPTPEEIAKSRKDRFDNAEVEILDICGWGDNEALVTNETNTGMVIGWWAKDIGVGELTIYTKVVDGKVVFVAESEAMGTKFVGRVLAALHRALLVED